MKENTLSRAGPILEKPVLAWLYCAYIVPVLPSLGLWCNSSKTSLVNKLALEGYITRVVFQYSIVR